MVSLMPSPTRAADLAVAPEDRGRQHPQGTVIATFSAKVYSSMVTTGSSSAGRARRRP